MQPLLTFLRRLSEAKIHHQLTHVRDEAIMVEIAVPGERWEVEVIEDGEVEVEVFRSDGEIRGAEMLDDLFSRFSD